LVAQFCTYSSVCARALATTTSVMALLGRQIANAGHTSSLLLRIASLGAAVSMFMFQSRRPVYGAFVGHQRHFLPQSFHHVNRDVSTRAEQVAQASPTFDLIKSQYQAGVSMRELGEQLSTTEIEVDVLDGHAKVVMDGAQRLHRVEIDSSALEVAGGANESLAEALLGALQQAHDESHQGAKSRIWGLYQNNGVLLQSPLTQIGFGSTAQDLWVNVTKTEDTLRMAAELFDKFDENNDGYWNLAETQKVQMATEGTEMPEEAFTSLLLATAPNGGRELTEADLERGLSKEQVIELYTSVDFQRQLGFVLSVQRDHAKVFATGEEDSPAPAPAPALLD